MNDPIAVWFPTVRTGTGTDIFTVRLATALRQRGVRAEITWLPLRAEYAPWTVAVPQTPDWASIAHVNTWLHTRFLPLRLPLVASIHHAVHHPDARAYKGAVRAAYHRWWIAPNERRVLRRAAEAVAVSEFVAGSARQSLVDMPMQVIYNGVDTATYCPAAVPRISGKPFRLLYVGSWMTRKGVDLLPSIMRGLGDEFELRFTGGLAAHEKVHMPPNAIDIGRLGGDAAVVAAMQHADALLFPSRSEGHPLVAIEAMACGLPIIGMRGSSVVEAVSDGETGLMCPRDDVSSFIAAIRALAADRAYCASLAMKARKCAVERFSEQSMIDAHIRLYETALALAP